MIFKSRYNKYSFMYFCIYNIIFTVYACTMCYYRLYNVHDLQYAFLSYYSESPEMFVVICMYYLYNSNKAQIYSKAISLKFLGIFNTNYTIVML